MKAIVLTSKQNLVRQKVESQPNLGKTTRSSITESLWLRRAPVSWRGQSTVDSILDATARLIAENGHEVVSTNLVATTADINIASLYQYFSSKQSVLMALFDRQTKGQIELLTSHLLGLFGSNSWQISICKCIDRFAEARSKEPGASRLRLALKGSPEMEPYERCAFDDPITVLAQFLVQRGNLSFDRAMLVSRSAIDMSLMFIDSLSGECDPRNEHIVDEAKIAIVSYLDGYLGKSALSVMYAFKSGTIKEGVN